MRKILISFLILFVLAFGIYIATKIFDTQSLSATLRYASGPAIIEAPIHAAYQKGFFEDENLEIDLTIFPDGKTSLYQLLEGEVDIAGVMATPVVYESFNRSDFSIIAVLEHPKFHHFLVDASSVSKPEDLIGQKVGVTKGTSGEYLMYSYLIYNQIYPFEVEVVYLTGPEMIEAMLSGEICGMFSWDPYIYEVKKKLRDSVKLVGQEELVPPSWVFVTSEKFIQNHPDLIIDFLQSVKKGVHFANEFPKELLEINATISGRDNSNISAAEIRDQFHLHLKQKLLLDLEAQARWLISRQDTMKHNVPDFLDIIYPDAMMEVSPASVTLIK